MRSKFVALLTAIVCLLPIAASADISRISPQSIPYGTVEESLAVFGTSLSGTESTFVLFDGPAGQFFVVPSNAIDNDNPDAPPQYPSTELVAFIPGSIPYEPGPYSISVIATNIGESPRTYGPVTFEVGPPTLDGPPLISSSETVFEEATSRAGAIVSFDVSAQNPNGDPVPVSCSPASGSEFPIGGTIVTCTASNAFGTSTATIFVVVGDFTPPVVTVPDDIETEDSIVTFDASAADNIDGAIPVTCSPASGSTFAAGVTQVTCTATDSSGNLGIGTFYVRRSGGEPVVTVPADITIDSPDGNAVVYNYTATATNGGVIECLPTGNTFAVGVTHVTCTARNLSGSDAKTFTVTVRDLSAPPPELTVPANITAEATSSAGAVVTFTATATNGATILCSPASGSTFALGTTTVNCTATNAGGSDADSFTITVRDTTPPVLSLPANITAEATSSAGAVVVYSAFSTDAVDGVKQATCNRASSSMFPIGTTAVTCTATDLAGHSVSGSFNITVRDTTPPVLNLPSTITAEAHFPGEARVTYSASATDAVSGTVAIHCSPASGSRFDMGTTAVQCTARDSRNNVATGSFNVIVRDTVPPVVLFAEAAPGVLWPANGKMVNVTVVVVAFDTVDILPTSRIISVTSNQPVTGSGDNTSPDWQITGPYTLKLRAERTNNVERVYTITIETSDESGNVTTSTEKVYVAKSRRRAS